MTIPLEEIKKALTSYALECYAEGMTQIAAGTHGNRLGRRHDDPVPRRDADEQDVTRWRS